MTFTFQNVSISTMVQDLTDEVKSKLYIPKCIYFYEEDRPLICIYDTFTFQNVSIST